MMNLIQFPYSHFCGKARWALDYKGQSYTVENLIPGLHLLRTRRLCPKSSVPILQHDQTVVQGSAAIIDYLDAHWPERPLTPQDAEAARQAAVWEQFAEKEIGIHLRRWFYSHLLHERRHALPFLLTGATPRQAKLLTLGFPLLRQLLRKGLHITPASSAASRQRLEAALDRLDQALPSTEGYLVGGQFSRADLSVCALLGPLVAPEQDEASLAARLPATFHAWRQTQSHRPCFDWLRRIHRDDR
ncbi:hypothetical protein THUN1379_11290 [Paludibacterium sp. THUN1379]|uniref:glutathione S-transferase family protein n=1 Tax=Paludibacterium sp. THUN1379 TaxID=3112107 RepID=UPI0030920E0C|nr:hypothetical protein THUN1379_11290 [Paludibacterium sp. THUN1379]